MLANQSSATTPAANTLSFERVYADNLSLVAWLVRRMGVRQNARDDVVQDVFCVVHQKLESFEERSKISTWLFAIVVRVVHNHWRTLRRKGASQALVSVVDDTECLVAPAEYGPHEQLKRREAARIWRRVLARMDPGKAELLEMFELEGRTLVDIAGATGVPLNTAYSRLRAARRDFARMVADHLGEPEQAFDS